MNNISWIHLTNQLWTTKTARSQNALGECKFCFTKTLLITGTLNHSTHLFATLRLFDTLVLRQQQKRNWCFFAANWRIDSVHGVREQNVFLNLILTERNMQVNFDLKLSVYSLGLKMCPLPFKFNFSLTGWPLQPPRENIYFSQKLKKKNSLPSYTL